MNRGYWKATVAKALQYPHALPRSRRPDLTHSNLALLPPFRIRINIALPERASHTLRGTISNGSVSHSPHSTDEDDLR